MKRRIAILLPAFVLVAPVLRDGDMLVAQQKDPIAELSPTVRANLWPERKLSPAEAELKQHIIVLRDSVAVANGSAAFLLRQMRSGSGDAVLRSLGRRLAGDCTTASSAAGTMSVYASGLSTDDKKWGESSIRTFRAASANLQKAMTSCASSMTKLIEGRGTLDKARIVSTAEAASLAITNYTAAADGLLNTLKIPLDPRGARRI